MGPSQGDGGDVVVIGLIAHTVDHELEPHRQIPVGNPRKGACESLEPGVDALAAPLDEAVGEQEDAFALGKGERRLLALTLGQTHRWSVGECQLLDGAVPVGDQGWPALVMTNVPVAVSAMPYIMVTSCSAPS